MFFGNKPKEKKDAKAEKKPQRMLCIACNGSGGRNVALPRGGVRREICPVCGGTGYATQ